MKMQAFALVMLVGALAATTAVGEAGKKDAGKDGTWKVVAMGQGGKKLPDELIEKLAMTLILKGNSYTVMMGDKLVDKGTTKTDTTKKPVTVDILSSEGPNKGKTKLAIVELKDDSMKACYDMEGKARPTEFATKEGSPNVLIQYKREKK
jgi:uncharacterized protein (TIGR03067 family)